jgi:hemerythrin-like domain-containing protein
MDEPPADARDMFVAHTMFRREFGLMPRIVRGVAPGNSARTGLVADHIALMTEELTAHHQGEDRHIWPLLRGRCREECESLADIMEEQHHAVHDHLLEVGKAAGSWRQSASASMRDVLAEAIEQLHVVTREHLALEEERAVPLIEKYLTEVEYARAGQEAAAALPPDKLLVALGMAIYEGDPEVIDMMVSTMPPDVGPAIKDQAASAYATYAEKLYGTATPPRETS